MKVYLQRNYNTIINKKSNKEKKMHLINFWKKRIDKMIKKSKLKN